MSNVRLRNVVKSYGQLRVIHGVDLEIADNEFVVFVGPSGCGKSTLLRIIAGLEDIDEGSILIGDRDVTDLEPVDRGIAMVFQSYALYPHMSVEENMSFGLRVTKVPADEIGQRVAEASRTLQLDDLLERKPSQLSGGQRQRVAIGRAIVRKPDVFLFDEPLSNLDAELRVHMRIEIAQLHNRLGSTMIYVTHDQVEAMTLADKIVVLQAGRVEQVGTPLQLFDDPDNLFVAGFIGSPKMNFLPVLVTAKNDVGVEVALETAEGPKIAVPLKGKAPAPGTELTLGLRPAALKLGRGAATIEARADVCEMMGDIGYLHCYSGKDNRLTLELRDRDFPRIGAPVMLGFDPMHAFLFDDTAKRVR